MDFHFATAWEAIADIVPERPAVICDDAVLKWRDYDDRAARLASVFDDHGLETDAKVGLYLHNSSEYLEAQYATFKNRCCPINVNYRYQADELVYLLNNADAEAIVFQGCYAPRIAEIRAKLPGVRLFIQVDDGTEPLLDGALDYQAAISENPPMSRIQRDPEEIYMLYTGGTTGLPKGVMYPIGHFCYLLTAMGAVARGLTPPERVRDLPEYIRGITDVGVSLVTCPLMHGTGMWLGAFVPLMAGGTVVLTSKLGMDPDLLWTLAAQHRATDIVIVGDAFARPMLASLDAAKLRGKPFDLTSVRQMASSGVMWSTEVKQGLLHHHDMVLTDIMGSSEGGMGSSTMTREASAQTAKFEMDEGVKVFSEDGREVSPGSEEIGMLATSGMVPIGYYKDPDKSAVTFRLIDGVRYSFPGDYAIVGLDGSITLLGRGSVCINTAGEKVFPEEVEEAVKRHEDIDDCLVVGVADERFGERVIAVASYREAIPGRGAGACTESELIDFARKHLAGYKLPKNVIFVDLVQRAPNGKADYKWAKATALAGGIAER